jgi:pilus assembly protein CpaB
MSRARRGILLVGLSLILGGLAASDVARRESAMARRLGPSVPVVVARADLPPGTRLAERHLSVRPVPRRYAPAGAATTPAEVLGGRLAAAVRAGAPVGVTLLTAAEAPAASPVRRGERAVPLLATGSPEMIVAGSRVDVLITRDHGTELALRGVEVLTAARAKGAPGAAGVPRVAVTLRVRVRQAVELTEAESFAREIRLLPRAAGGSR